MRVTAEKMAAGGRCIARIDGKAVFVSGMLPGEVADISLVARHKDFDEGCIVNLLETSPYRVQPACPQARLCGGCSLMIASHEGQRKFKKEILRDLLARFHCKYDSIIEEISSSPLEYRSRFQFHKSGEGDVGFCAKASGAVVPLADCPVAVREVRSLLKDGSLKKRASRVAKDRFNVFSYGGKTLIEGEGSSEFCLDFCCKSVVFDIRSFFQSNVGAFEKTARLIVQSLAGRGGKGGASFLDLYAGCGVFSLLALDAFDDLYLIEENRASCVAARANLGYNVAEGAQKKRMRVFEMRDSEWVKTREALRAFDAAVIDPPRGGIGKKAMQWLLQSKIGRIAYLSCNAPSLARDAALLVAGGWSLDRIVLCDFYPQTPHIEALGFFSREGEWS